MSGWVFNLFVDSLAGDKGCRCCQVSTSNGDLVGIRNAANHQVVDWSEHYQR